MENYNSAHDIIYDRMADSTFKVLSNYIERYYFGEINLKMFRNTDDMINTVSRQGEQ